MAESGSKIRLMAGYDGGTDGGRIFRIVRVFSISGALAEMVKTLAF